MGTSNSSKKLKVAEINVDMINFIVRDYAGAVGMKKAYSETFKSAGLFLRVTSLGMVSGLKDYNIDIELYHKHRNEELSVCKNKISEIFSNGKSAVKLLDAYLNQLRQHAVKLKREMQELKDEVIRHNATQASVADSWKKFYVATKWAADTTISVGGSTKNPVASAIAYLYGLSTELATVVATPEEADIWSFKGSLSAPKFMAWDYATGRALGDKLPLLQKPSAIVGILFASNDAWKNWN